MSNEGKARKPAPTGAFVLDKQLGRAAVEKKKVTFMVNLGSNHEIAGYITGMDNYTVMVAVPMHDDDGHAVGVGRYFVHKGSAAVIKISPTETLADEVESVREEVSKIGSASWRAFREKYLGHHGNEQEITS